MKSALQERSGKWSFTRILPSAAFGVIFILLSIFLLGHLVPSVPFIATVPWEEVSGFFMFLGGVVFPTLLPIVIRYYKGDNGS